jgi:hypothetical protein
MRVFIGVDLCAQPTRSLGPLDNTLAADAKTRCSNSLTRTAKSGLSLKNENSNLVTVDEDTTHPNSWPFVYPSAPFTIVGKVGSEPGIQGVVLNSAPVSNTGYKSEDGDYLLEFRQTLHGFDSRISQTCSDPVHWKRPLT